VLTNLSFGDFLEHSFGHDVPIHGNPWFFDVDQELWEPSPAEAVSHVTRLFQDPGGVLEPFTDRQIAQGLTYLFSTSGSGDNGWFHSTALPVPDRVRLVASIGDLFEKLFRPRCAPLLGHLSEGDPRSLNGVCYMWWDEFPSVALPDDPARTEIHAAAFRSLERILRMDSIACQESALHGLGHWTRTDESEVARIIDRYLGRASELDPRLVAYARAARSGCVL
jgi:hypothetical protein